MGGLVPSFRGPWKRGDHCAVAPNARGTVRPATEGGGGRTARAATEGGGGPYPTADNAANGHRKEGTRLARDEGRKKAKGMKRKYVAYPVHLLVIFGVKYYVH